MCLLAECNVGCRSFARVFHQALWIFRVHNISKRRNEMATNTPVYL